jgi:hypothetical protein
MKRAAGTKDKPVVSIPEIVMVAIVAVEPLTIVIMLHVEDFQIAVRIAERREYHLGHCPLITLGTV